MRQIAYELVPGEAGWVLRLKRIKILGQQTELLDDCLARDPRHARRSLAAG